MKTSNRKRLQFKALVNSEYTHTRIYKQLVKEEQIKIELIDWLLKIFNVDKTKNGEVTRFVLLELEINGHTEKIDIVVTDLNGSNMFLGYDWLVKHNTEFNWNNGMIQFIICPKEYKI